jgi:hypothetical protein
VVITVEVVEVSVVVITGIVLDVWLVVII